MCRVKVLKCFSLERKAKVKKVKVKKPEKKSKGKKSSQKKERKATQTLAVVLGDIFR